MSDRIYIGKNVKDLDISEPSAIITKVILIYTSENGDSTSIEVGDDTGRTLEVKVPWGNEEMAYAILNRVSNYQYRAYTAKQAKVNPAAELGDGVTIGDTYSGIFHQVTDFQFIDAPDIESPHENETDNEYKFESPQEREFIRQLYALGSRITQTAEYIRSEVFTDSDAEGLRQSILEQTAQLIQLSLEAYGITSYLRYTTDEDGIGVLILGVLGQNIELQLKNDRVSFVDTSDVDNPVELAYITNNRFFMPNATVTETMNFGDYQVDATSNGIIWKWVGR